MIHQNAHDFSELWSQRTFSRRSTGAVAMWRRTTIIDLNDIKRTLFIIANI